MSGVELAFTVGNSGVVAGCDDSVHLSHVYWENRHFNSIQFQGGARWATKLSRRRRRRSWFVLLEIRRGGGGGGELEDLHLGGRAGEGDRPAGLGQVGGGRGEGRDRLVRVSVVGGGLVAGGLQGGLTVQQGGTSQGHPGTAAARAGRGGGGVVLPSGPDTDYWHCRLKQ